MELIDLIRAKSDDQPSYLLKDHLMETAARVDAFHNFYRENMQNFSHRIEGETFEALAAAAIIHDLGKIDYNFQKKLRGDEKGEWEVLEEFLSPLKQLKRSPRHEIISIIWSTFLMGNDENDAVMRTAILLHHYNEYFINEKDLMELVFTYREAFETYLSFIIERRDELERFLEDLLDYIQDSIPSYLIGSAVARIKTTMDFDKPEILLTKIREYDDDISDFAVLYEPEENSLDFLVISGLLRKADYSASAGVDIEMFTEEVFQDIEEKIKSRIGGEPWQIGLINDFGDSGRLVLVAPTGSGKTEFSLLWASRRGRKFIYTLPLRVALNDIFMRLRDSDGYFRPDEIDILHSTAFIEYLREERRGRDTDLDGMLTSARLLASPVLLTTPDQVLITSLNYFGSDKVISAYPFSSIVIDEVQTYNEEMAAVIIKTLQMISELDGSILVMTATLPPYFRRFLDAMDFQVLDVSTINRQDEIKNLSMRRHVLKLMDEPLFSDELEVSGELDGLIEENAGKNILIVVNNVQKAVELYREYSDDPHVYLLHSRLLEKEKSRRIREIKEKQREDKGLMVISTQIIEASVDLDFDVMITEISTIDSQIQRWGRIYRNRDRDYNSTEPNIIVFTGTDRRTSLIYDKKVVDATRRVLRGYEGRALDYQMEKNMIEDVFREEFNGLSLREVYENRIDEILSDLDYFTVEKRTQAQRLFRNMAGYKVFIPEAVLRYSESEIELAFAELIKGDYRLWKDILAEIEERTGEKTTMWDLRRVLYEYSINVPVFYEEKSDFWSRTTGEFKGFYIWGNIDDEEVELIGELGLDSVFGEDESSFIF
ncbi:CRISPR-associated helicase Cas3' [Methanothermobacter sp. KEPCO-1]|uniref:CRISPR-associated helicase Cas3' n=1 Tax=Methanothermobacter sp. KEPCO-1 TaxID=2603820 RepID=UPI0011C6EFEC|nr:CRISPR-associated helicase Cas3' [Methanothermobacter sp. KEPCO-1]QEF94770.1 CRISPR-associated helicase Cas3' [Methanothermobacter sp. KEPCO-1]